MAIADLLVFHHSHYDRGYTHSEPVVRRMQRDFLDIALEQCDATDRLAEPHRLRWTAEASLAVCDWLDGADERQRGRMRRRIAEGRICPTALWTHGTPLMDRAE